MFLFHLLLYPMESLHCYESIISDVSSLNGSIMFLFYYVKENSLQLVSNSLGDYFNGNITKTDRSKVFYGGMFFSFLNKENENIIHSIWAFLIIKGLQWQCFHVLLTYVPINLAKQSWYASGPRSLRGCTCWIASIISNLSKSLAHHRICSSFSLSFTISQIALAPSMPS